MNAGAKFGSAQPLRRIEDQRFLTGAGRYVDDIAPAGALHAVFLRSTVAHGVITALDLDAAREVPGVHLVLGADDLAATGIILGMKGEQVKNRDGSRGALTDRPVLAQGRVRHVGEPIAVVICDTVEAGRDAAELIGVEIDDLSVVLGLEPGAGALHDTAPGNLAYDYGIGDAAGTDAAFEASVHKFSLEVVHNRVIANAMEPRGAYAEWDEGRLHLCVNGQGVWDQKKELIRMLRLDAGAVRVTNPDVGGGFGMKAMAYPEYVVIAQAARMLGKPVRWMSERGEGMLTDNAGRDLVARADIGFDADLRITAYRVNLVSNLGAYNSQFGQPIQSELFAKVLTGVYDIKRAYLGARGVYTNTTPVDAYRGAGRPEAIYTIERVMDHAARVLGVDPFDLRARNFVTKFPYATPTGEVYDVGDFHGVLNKLRVEADVAGYAARQAGSEAKGLLRGLGLGVYIESILGSPEETARLTLDAGGGATLYVGTQSNGQGHETVYAMMVAAQTALDASQIRIVQGDSDRIANGGGTGGSRSVTVQGTAIKATVGHMIAGLSAFLDGELGLQGVTFSDATFGAAGSNLRLTFAEAADLAREKDRVDLLDVAQTTKIDGKSFPNGAHLAEVEIDPETGAIRLDRYWVVDDFGVLISQTLVEGQIHGGVAQGFGQAVMENAVFDDQGQLLTGSFMDYAMPRAGDMPMIGFATHSVPTKRNPLGMKGCGEAGTVGALGAVSNAVLDALAQRGVTHIDMPYTPTRVWGWLQEASAGSV